MGLLVGSLLAALVVVAVLWWFWQDRHQHPENTSGHGPARERTTSGDVADPDVGPYPGVDRPAGPGAEDMGVPERGQPAPTDRIPPPPD